jgi:hypothetical protein
LIIKVPIEVTQTGEGLKATVAGLQEVERQATKAKSSSDKLSASIKGWATGLVSVAAVRQIGIELQEASNWARDLNKAVQQTGLSRTSLQQLQKSAQGLGYDVTSVTELMTKMQRAVSGLSAEGANKLGLSFEKIKNLAPEEQLEALARQVMNVRDPTDRAAMAMAVFGEQGAKLIPLLEEISSGAYKMNAALGDDTVDSLAKSEKKITELTQKWEDAKRSLLATFADLLPYAEKLAWLWSPGSASEMGQGISNRMRGTQLMVQPGKYRGFQMPSAADFLDPSGLSLGIETAAQKAAVQAYQRDQAEATARQKAAAKELLDLERERMKAQISIVSGRDDEAAAMREIAELADRLALQQEQIEASRLQALRGTRLREGDMLPSVGGSGLWTRYQDVIDQELENAGEAANEAAKATADWSGSLNTLANQLANLAQVTGGFTGKLLGMLSAMSSGAGGILSGLSGWKDAGKMGGLSGFLGKLSSGLGIVGSAVGLVGGLVGGIKSLFGGKSKEERAAEEAAKRQREEERKAAIEEARRLKIEGLKSAQAAAESLMDRMAKGGLSEGLTASLGTLIGKVQEALLKSGLGYMATPGLRESEAFMGAQGMAGDIAQLLAGMRAGGALDSGLLAAAGASAEELRAQAQTAAEEAGMAPADAVKAGFGAIAPLLKEQLNAALASGQELDANTRALIEEAKKNGINIVADPMVESVAVQKDMLKELKHMNGRGGGVPDESFASGTFGLRVVKRDMLAQIHEGEGFMVVPKDKMGRGVFGSFARGTDDPDREGGGGGRIPGGGGGPSGPAPSSGGGTAGEIAVEVRRLAREVRRRPTEAVTQVFQPTFKLDPLQTVESREELGRTLTDQFLRDLRNNPTVQYAVQRAAGTR